MRLLPAVTVILPENVETPATLKSSKSVSPSTSKLPLASISPVNVETPVTFKLPYNLLSPRTTNHPEG